MGTDDLFKKNREGLTKRPVDTRSMHARRWLIVCEGEKTEPNYLSGLISYINALSADPIVDAKICGVGKCTKSLVAHAYRLKQTANIGFERVFVVFDKDDFPDGDFNTSISLCKSLEMTPIWSNQSFELWLLLHFCNISGALNRDQLCQKLDQQLQELRLGRYLKNDESIFHKINTYGDIGLAIRYATELHKLCLDARTPAAKSNPCTLIYQLVNDLYELCKIIQ